MFRGGPLDLLLGIPEIEKIFDEAPLDFATNLVNRFNEIRECDVILDDRFRKVYEYFREAKKCYITGCFRASLIMVQAALECCLRLDFYYQNGKEFDGPFHKLLENASIKEEIAPYAELADVCRKVRNDVVHVKAGKQFQFHKSIVKTSLETIAILINHMIKKPQKSFLEKMA